MAFTHPTKEHLAAYAGGASSEGMSLLIASHMTYCAECRKVVEEFETVGGAAFEADLPGEVSVPSLEAVFDRLDDAGPDDSLPPAARDSRVPFPILRELDGGLDDLNWKFRLPGIHEYEFPDYAGETVSLIKVKPGAGMLHHTHHGEEATLILTGAMEDGDMVYRRGDVALADHRDDHRPRVVGDEICYCLIVMAGGMKFTGRVGRALNILTR